MTVVAGIDEAGYGPVIGPLVVAAAAYRLRDGVTEATLDRVVRDRGVRRRGLPTLDSKRLYQAGGSLARLETSALGHAVVHGGALPVRAGGLLRLAVDLSPADLDELPWYDGLARRHLPLVAERDAILESTSWHEAWLARRGLELAGLWIAPLLVPRFNRLSTAAGSKAWTLFRTTGRLIERLVAAFPHEELVIHVDRHGGRVHYADLLQTCFPLAPLQTLHERPRESAYQLVWPGRSPVRIDFRVQADGRRAPVALASILAKYARELFMERLNGWFAAQRRDLRPTAGYYGDGRRFIAEVEVLLRRSGRTPDDFVRCR